MLSFAETTIIALRFKRDIFSINYHNKMSLIAISVYDFALKQKYLLEFFEDFGEKLLSHCDNIRSYTVYIFLFNQQWLVEYLRAFFSKLVSTKSPNKHSAMLSRKLIKMIIVSSKKSKQNLFAFLSFLILFK